MESAEHASRRSSSHPMAGGWRYVDGSCRSLGSDSTSSGDPLATHRGCTDCDPVEQPIAGFATDRATFPARNDPACFPGRGHLRGLRAGGCPIRSPAATRTRGTCEPGIAHQRGSIDGYARSIASHDPAGRESARMVECRKRIAIQFGSMRSSPSSGCCSQFPAGGPDVASALVPGDGSAQANLGT